MIVNLIAALNENLSQRIAARKKEQDDTLGAILLGTRSPGRWHCDR